MTWRERIQNARDNGGKFTQEDERRASQWSTCAVGEQHQALPEVVFYTDIMSVGIPRDDILYTLGGGATGFYSAVNGNQVDRAESLLDQIEDRVLAMKRAH